jgi:quercetin dioxygenase-like cupin family protein
VSSASSSRDRPSGETGGSPQRQPRQVAAPVLDFDLAAELASLRQEASWQRGDRNARTLVEEPSLRIVLIAARAGARFREHHTRGWVSLQTLAGHGRVHLATGPADVPAGHLLALQHALPHDVEAVEESTFLLTVAWPVQETAHP